MSCKREKPFRHAVIREQHMLLLDGDAIGCIVLNQMIEWQRTVDTRERSDSRWFYKSSRQLAQADLFEAWTRRTIKRRLDDLVDRGYLHKREVDGAHKANEWHVDIDALNRDLAEYGAKVRGYPSDYLASSAPGGGADSTGAVHSAPDGGAERTGPPNARGSENTKTEDTSDDTATAAQAHDPTPEDHEPDTSGPTSDDTLREFVERKVRAKCMQHNYGIKDQRLDDITSDIRDSDLPDDAYRDYVRAEVSRIRSARKLVEWLGGDKSVEDFLDRSPDYEPDVPLVEQCVSRGPSGRLHHESPGDREMYADKLEPSKTADWGETEDTEVAS